MGRGISKPLSERFWSKVVKGPNCWEWIAYRGWYGYGRISRSRKEGPMSAHRVSYELAYGPIPEGMDVCHHCDNPACIRPDHLYLGTAKDNLQDMARKRRGTLIHSKISLEQVRQIRSAYTPGNTRTDKPGKVTQKMLALQYGISPAEVGDIIRHRRWKFID